MNYLCQHYICNCVSWARDTKEPVHITVVSTCETKGPWNESVKERDVKGKGSTGWPFPFVPLPSQTFIPNGPFTSHLGIT